MDYIKNKQYIKDLRETKNKRRNWYHDYNMWNFDHSFEIKKEDGVLEQKWENLWFDQRWLFKIPKSHYKTRQLEYIPIRDILISNEVFYNYKNEIELIKFG